MVQQGIYGTINELRKLIKATPWHIYSDGHHYAEDEGKWFHAGVNEAGVFSEDIYEVTKDEFDRDSTKDRQWLIMRPPV